MPPGLMVSPCVSTSPLCFQLGSSFPSSYSFSFIYGVLFNLDRNPGDQTCPTITSIQSYCTRSTVRRTGRLYVSAPNVMWDVGLGFSFRFIFRGSIRTSVITFPVLWTLRPLGASLPMASSHLFRSQKDPLSWTIKGTPTILSSFFSPPVPSSRYSQEIRSLAVAPGG